MKRIYIVADKTTNTILKITLQKPKLEDYSSFKIIILPSMSMLYAQLLVNNPSLSTVFKHLKD